jgi:hypothetical protein
MRVRDFRWSTDAIVPAAFLFISAGAGVSGVSRVALLSGALFGVQTLRVLVRVERRKADGSYAKVAAPWENWTMITRLMVSGLGGGLILFTALALTGVVVHVAAITAGGLTVACVLLGGWLLRNRTP